MVAGRIERQPPELEVILHRQAGVPPPVQPMDLIGEARLEVLVLDRGAVNRRVSSTSGSNLKSVLTPQPLFHKRRGGAGVLLGHGVAGTSPPRPPEPEDAPGE